MKILLVLLGLCAATLAQQQGVSHFQVQTHQNRRQNLNQRELGFSQGQQQASSQGQRFPQSPLQSSQGQQRFSQNQIIGSSQGQQQRFPQDSQGQQQRFSQVSQGQQQRFSQDSQGQQQRFSQDSQGQQQRFSQGSQGQQQGQQGFSSQQRFSQGQQQQQRFQGNQGQGQFRRGPFQGGRQTQRPTTRRPTTTTTTTPRTTPTTPTTTGPRLLNLPQLDLCQKRPKQWQHGKRNYYFSWDQEEALGVPQSERGKKVDWLEARNQCRLRCMDAVSLETEAEAKMVREFLKSRNLTYIWTSGRLCDFKGCDERPDLKPLNIKGWFWSNTNTKMAPTNKPPPGWSFQPWSQKGHTGGPQPDNAEFDINQTSESCLGVLNNIYEDGIVWHDIACYHKKPYICEDSDVLIQFIEVSHKVKL